MDGVRLAYTLVLLASVLVVIILLVYSYKRRTMPGANYFILILFSAIIYNGAYIGEINSNKLSMAMIWFNIEHIAIPLQQYFWVMMSFEYVRVKKKHIKLAKYLMLYHPVLFWLIFYTNHIHYLYILSISFVSNGYFPVIISSRGILYMAVVVSGTILTLIATVLYIRGFMKSTLLHRHGYSIMIIASLIPWISIYVYAANVNYLGIDYFPVTTIISGILYVFGIFQFRIFNTIPIATEIVFRKSKDGILMVDLTDRIIDVNDAFLNIYPDLKEITNKSTLTAFIKNHLEFNNAMDKSEKSQYQLVVSGKVKYYDYEIIKIFTEDGLEIGKILTINDVTLFVENRKMLESIASNAISKAETNEISFLQAQIKPHFLNNTLSVIASMITRDPDAAKDLIADLGEYLADHYYFDSTSAMVLLDKELETVNTYVAIEKARFRERLKFHLVCDNIPPINIPRLALQPLVENAIRHGVLRKAEGGNVWLKISSDEDKICFEIKDDGVGVMDERIMALLIGEDKKQGIGILNINKRLLKYYGEGLEITSVVGQGTSVRFSIPTREP